VDPPGHRRSGGLDRTRDARDSILLLILFRSFSYGDGGRSTEHDRICRIECVSKWVSLHSFEVGHVPDAMTRRADRALGRRSRATASRRLNPGLYRHV